MHKILCSTGALIGRPNGRDYHLLKQFCPQLECDGFEFMLYGTWYDQVEELVPFLESLRLHIPVMHCEKSLSEHISRGGDEELQEAFRKFEINCSAAEKLGAEKMVFHLWNGLISDSHFENNLRAYPELRDRAEKHGLTLLVENVICHGDPMAHWVELRQHYPEIRFVFDTKMAHFHRQLELLYQPEYEWLWKENHIRHYHVNDYDGGYKDWDNLKVLPLGKGHIDFERFFRFVGQTGYQGDFTFESTGFDQTGAVNFGKLNEQFALARKYLDQV
ncbi:MAG: sugar phosphate isomerase/epimerase [Clostridia bacterium]|nr:sugar phosphate isomerase/epimerase [Clostridia bacterium]